MKCKNLNCENEVGKNPYRGKSPVYCSTKCRHVDAVRNLRLRRKKEAVAYLGGKCVKCAYNKCVGALHFHHKNPEQKEFGIGKWITFSWEKIQKELDKCEILCANCHAEHHNE